MNNDKVQTLVCLVEIATEVTAEGVLLSDWLEKEVDDWLFGGWCVCFEKYSLACRSYLVSPAFGEE